MVVFALGMSVNAFAGERAGEFSLSPASGGYMFEGQEDFRRNNLTLGLGLGYNFTENVAVEGVINYIIGRSKPDTGRADGVVYRVDGLYNFMPEGKLVPYLSGGIGCISVDHPVTGHDTDFLFDYGAGIKYFITDDFALRGEVRHLLPTDELRNNLMYTAGLVFQFGGENEAEPEPEPAPKPDPTAAPAPAPAPAPVVVAPVDSDGDGVFDNKDRCPDTTRGAKVDNDGCPIPLKEEICIILNIEFDFDKATIRPEYHNEIKKVADCMTEYPDTNAVLEGHTDSEGTEEYNIDLSQRRADAVKEYLVNKFGMAAARISTKAFGESQPIADNNTEEGRQKNRRLYARINATRVK